MDSHLSWTAVPFLWGGQFSYNISANTPEIRSESLKLNVTFKLELQAWLHLRDNFQWIDVRMWIWRLHCKLGVLTKNLCRQNFARVYSKMLGLEAFYENVENLKLILPTLLNKTLQACLSHFLKLLQNIEKSLQKTNKTRKMFRKVSKEVSKLKAKSIKQFGTKRCFEVDDVFVQTYFLAHRTISQQNRFPQNPNHQQTVSRILFQNILFQNIE